MRDENELIEETKRGNERAFHHLYEMHVGRLYRFMRQFTQDGDQVEDWVQRAFIKAYGNIFSFEGRAKFSSWLIRLAINEMRMDRRRAQLFVLGDAGGKEEPADDSVNEFEWSETMRSLLGQLSDDKKAVFILHAVEGYSHAEIGDMLGIAESSSRSILTRTKKILQNEWNRQEL